MSKNQEEISNEDLKQLMRDRGFFSLWWSIPDIISQGETDGFSISQEEAEDIAGILEHTDANLGINWDQISYIISDYMNKGRKIKTN